MVVGTSPSRRAPASCTGSPRCAARPARPSRAVPHRVDGSASADWRATGSDHGRPRPPISPFRAWWRRRSGPETVRAHRGPAGRVGAPPVAVIVRIFCYGALVDLVRGWVAGPGSSCWRGPTREATSPTAPLRPVLEPAGCRPSAPGNSTRTRRCWGSSTLARAGAHWPWRFGLRPIDGPSLRQASISVFLAGRSRLGPDRLALYRELAG